MVGCERERVIVEEGREELAIGGESGQLVLVLVLVCLTSGSVHNLCVSVCTTVGKSLCVAPVNHQNMQPPALCVCAHCPPMSMHNFPNVNHIPKMHTKKNAVS